MKKIFFNNVFYEQKETLFFISLTKMVKLLKITVKMRILYCMQNFIKYGMKFIKNIIKHMGMLNQYNIR